MATINKAALVEKLLLTDAFAGQTKKFTTEFVEDFFKMMADEIVAGNTISIPGFGKIAPFVRQNGTKKAKFTAFKDFADAVKAS